MHAACFGLYLGHPQACNTIKTLRGHFLTVSILIMLKYTVYYSSGKSSPITGLGLPRGFQEVKVPTFHENGTG